MKKYVVKEPINCDSTNDFLKAAITDITGNLALLDTKISIVMATVGVILGLVVACKSNLLRAFHYYSSICPFNILFLFLAIFYIISIISVFACGINCITIRFGKSKLPSLWFFETEEYDGISESKYLYKITQMRINDITKNLANEVYKLNTINNRKMHAGRRTIVLFAISCAFIAALMIMVGISYLVV